MYVSVYDCVCARQDYALGTVGTVPMAYEEMIAYEAIDVAYKSK